MNKSDRLMLWILAAVFVAAAVFCAVLATSYAPAEPATPALKVEAVGEPTVPEVSPPDETPSVDTDVDLPIEPAAEPADPVEPTVEPAAYSPPACCKECGGFVMDRPNCLAADCHCGDGCPCDETARCCPECLCDLKPTPEPPQKPIRAPAKPVRGPAWFYCLTCRQYSEYTARVTLRSTMCRHCGQWGAYRAVKPQEKPAADYETPYYERDSPRWRNWRPFGGFGGGFGFGDISNGQACVGTT